jgi:hypothetical protein
MAATQDHAALFGLARTQAEEEMTLPLTATPKNDRVLLAIEGADAATVSVELGRHKAVGLILSLRQAVNALPIDPTIPPHFAAGCFEVKASILPSWNCG